MLLCRANNLIVFSLRIRFLAALLLYMYLYMNVQNVIEVLSSLHEMWRLETGENKFKTRRVNCISGDNVHDDYNDDYNDDNNNNNDWLNDNRQNGKW